MLIIILVLFGLVAGILAGMLGIGGGIIFAPVLFYMFEDQGLQDPELWAIGSSLFCTMSSSLSGTLKHMQMKNIYFNESIKVAVFGVFGTIVGKAIATSPYFSQQIYIILFSLLMIYTGINFLLKALNWEFSVQYREDSESIQWPQGLKIGAGGGIVASLAGVGGGIVLVPMMNLYYKLSFPKTVSISEYAIILISFSGALQMALEAPETGGISSYTLGYVDFGTSFAMVIGAIFGANLGAWLHNRVNLSYLQILFACLIFFVAAMMIYDTFG
ncbi:MAG: sulfite exporter TauE/SafE family protein [Balneolales bacterium]